jgi:hypothetical protein
MLVLTSQAFATVVVHAYYRRCAAYHHLFLAVTVLSVLFHATKGETVRLIDKFVAHAAFLYVLSDVQHAVKAKQGWLLIYPLAVIVLWFAQGVFPARAERLHACLHVVAVTGLHMFLAWLH